VIQPLQVRLRVNPGKPGDGTGRFPTSRDGIPGTDWTFARPLDLNDGNIRLSLVVMSRVVIGSMLWKLVRTNKIEGLRRRIPLAWIAAQPGGRKSIGERRCSLRLVQMALRSTTTTTNHTKGERSSLDPVAKTTTERN
jgi:hypothetical protein